MLTTVDDTYYKIPNAKFPPFGLFPSRTSSCQMSGNWQEPVRGYNTSPSIKAGFKIFENVRLAKLLREAYSPL